MTLEQLKEEGCPFCDESKIKSEILGFDDVIVFTPLNPVCEGHTLVVPRQHVTDFTDNPEVTALVIEHASRIAQMRGGDYNLITSKGRSATQSVFHLHVHLIPRKAEDGLLLPWTGKETLHHQLQKAREEEREKIAEMLSKAGDNKISMLDDDNFTGTYWISLNDAYRLLTGRQVNHDWEQGKIEKNATVEMVIRKSINPDHSELDQDKTNGL